MLAALSGGEVLQQQQQQQLVGLRKNPVRVAVTSMGTPEACAAPPPCSASDPSGSSSSAFAALAARNLARATKAAEAAAAGGADLVVLAETFCCSGMTTLQMKAYAEDQNSRGHPDLRAVRSLAQRLSVNFAAGFFLQEGSYFRNAALFIDRSGRLLGRYYKTYPLPSELDSGVLPGEQQASAVLDTDLGRVGLAIGLDASWPQLFSGIASRGADFCVWLSASGSGLGLQALALSNRLPIVSGVMDNNAKVIAATGRVKAQTNRWERLVLKDLYIRDSFGLFTTYGQNDAIGKVLQLYGGRVRVEACEEENFWTIEAVDPTLKVPAIAQHLGLVTHADYLAFCARLRKDAAARKNEPPLSSSASGRKRGRPPGAAAAATSAGAGRRQQQRQQQQQQQQFEEVASDDAAFEAVVFSQQ